MEAPITKARKVRAKSPLNNQTLQWAWQALRSTKPDGDPLTATELGRSSNGWRKLLAYLHEPEGSPQRDEAESMLRKLRIIYAGGDFNSRLFIENMTLPTVSGLLAGYGGAAPIITLARTSVAWGVAHIILNSGTAPSKAVEAVELMLISLGLQLVNGGVSRLPK